ncbi:spore germination protein GerPE [Paenibacillus thermotolerans]|uniref:spore germination protein GerPE n=1 Tax=Paenibacillus thermotolerans TaxID=3027807 RepID=UPI002368563A|nr:MULTISPECIES: spore germination protein GerPE [unclassified Paenibacillus]
MFRTSRVGGIKVRSLLFSSTIHVGDCLNISPHSSVLAIQREQPRFRGNEGDLSRYPVFQQPFVRPEHEEPDFMSVESLDPFIDVGIVDIIGISVAAVLQIGSTGDVDTTTRVKHVREILPRRR